MVENTNRVDIESVNDYIENFPELVRERLIAIRNRVHEVIPNLEEKISWRMPTLYKGKKRFFFAAFKDHIGIFPGPDIVSEFAPRLMEYKVSKGGIQFTYRKPLPIEIIEEIAKAVLL